MKHIILLLSFSILLNLNNLWADVVVPVPTSEPSKIFPLKDIKPGLKGYGITVFEGIKPTKFKVEILGVLGKSSPNFNLIVAKLDHPILKKTGVIAGMSGSPVYIDNKFVGTVSYAFPYAKEPIALLTPAKYIVNLLKRSPLSPPKEPPMFLPLSRLDEKNTSDIVPVATPLLVSGMHPSLFKVLKSKLKSLGLTPINYSHGTYSGEIRNNSNSSLKPGDAIGMVLVSGDMSLVAVGTVSYKKGPKIVALGHPFIQSGPISIPITKEYIITSLASRYISFKLSSTLKEVGILTDDRMAGTIGVLGKRASMIPVIVKLSDPNYGQHVFKFKVARYPAFLANLISAVISESLLRIGSITQETTFNLQYSISLLDKKSQKIRTINLENTITGGDNANNIMYATYLVLFPLQTLIYNEFNKIDIAGIKVKVSIFPEWQALKIEKLSVLNKYAEPGKYLNLLITLKEYKGKRIYKKVRIKLPPFIQKDYVYVGVNNAVEDYIMSLYMGEQPGGVFPNSLDTLVDILSKLPQYNELVVWVTTPTKSGVTSATELANLPTSLIGIFTEDRTTGNAIINSRIKKYYRTNYFIYNSQMIKVPVRR